MLTRQTLGQLLRYGVVGLANTAVGVSIMTALGLLGVHYVLYTLMGYSVAFVVSFYLNRRYTFQSGVGWSRLTRFVIANLGNLALVQAVQITLIEALGWHEVLGVAAGMILYVGVGFVAAKLWVFREPTTRAASVS